MSQEEKEKTPNKFMRILRSEILVGSLVALLSILTALAGYQASIMDSKANEFSLNAQRTMSEANRDFLRAGQAEMRDFVSYDNYFANLNSEAEENYRGSFSTALTENLSDADRQLFDEIYFEALESESELHSLNFEQLYILDIISYDNAFAATNLEAAENYKNSFSDALIKNLEDLNRTLFDDEYYEDLDYDFLDGCFIEADKLFEQEGVAGGIADQYQLIMFIFAVSLAMAAWASLMDDTGTMRIIFILFAFAMLAYGSSLYLGIDTSAVIPTEANCLNEFAGK